MRVAFNIVEIRLSRTLKFHNQWILKVGSCESLTSTKRRRYRRHVCTLAILTTLQCAEKKKSLKKIKKTIFPFEIKAAGSSCESSQVSLWGRRKVADQLNRRAATYPSLPTSPMRELSSSLPSRMRFIFVSSVIRKEPL